MNIFVVHASHRLTDHLAHGDGLIAWEIVRTLADRGHQLWVVAPTIEVANREIPGVRLYELRCTNSSRIVCVVDYMVRVRRLFAELSKGVTFDVIHQLNPVARGYSLAMLGTKTPLVLGAFVGDWPIPKRKKSSVMRLRSTFVRLVRDSVDMFAQRQARALLLTTPFASNRTPGIDLESPRVYFAPHGIDTNFFSPCASATDPPRKAKSILFVGKSTHKGVFTMLAAFERVAAARGDARLTIAGEGPNRDGVSRMVAGSRFKERIEVLGGVSRDAMPGVIRSADLVCVPSFGEPYGMVALEAMSTGKPIVATRAGGIPYLVEPEGSLLVEPGDDRGLAEAVLTYLEDPERSARAGAINRQTAVEKYAWNRIVEGMERAYVAVSR